MQTDVQHVRELLSRLQRLEVAVLLRLQNAGTLLEFWEIFIKPFSLLENLSDVICGIVVQAVQGGAGRAGGGGGASVGPPQPCHP